MGFPSASTVLNPALDEEKKQKKEVEFGRKGGILEGPLLQLTRV
jgi:hypothetical protein